MGQSNASLLASLQGLQVLSVFKLLHWWISTLKLRRSPTRSVMMFQRLLGFYDPPVTKGLKVPLHEANYEFGV